MLRIFEDQKVSDSLRSVAAPALFPKSLLPRVGLTCGPRSPQDCNIYTRQPYQRTPLAPMWIGRDKRLSGNKTKVFYYLCPRYGVEARLRQLSSDPI